jgi:hypothetical protein
MLYVVCSNALHLEKPMGEAIDAGGEAAGFEAYVDRLAKALGDADRVAPMHAYCTGLLPPGGREVPLSRWRRGWSRRGRVPRTSRCCTSWARRRGTTRRCCGRCARPCCRRWARSRPGLRLVSLAKPRWRIERD